MARIRLSNGPSIGEHSLSLLQNFLDTIMEKNGWLHYSYSKRNEAVNAPFHLKPTLEDKSMFILQ